MVRLPAGRRRPDQKNESITIIITIKSEPSRHFGVRAGNKKLE